MKSIIQHKQDVISYLEQCSKHTFKNKENQYFFVRLSEDKLSYTTTLESNGTKSTLNKSLEKMFENISVEIVKSYLKQKLFGDPDYIAVKRTKPVRRFIEGDMSIHIPEKYLVAEKENILFQEAI